MINNLLSVESLQFLKKGAHISHQDKIALWARYWGSDDPFTPSKDPTTPEEVSTKIPVKTHYSKIREFIYRVSEIVEYMEHFHPFSVNHGLPENKNTKNFEFTLSFRLHHQNPHWSHSVLQAPWYCRGDISRLGWWHTPKKTELVRWTPPTWYVREEKVVSN